MTNLDKKSYDFSDESDSRSKSKPTVSVFDEDDEFAIPAAYGEVPDANQVLLKMKDQIDVLESRLQDRTYEIRENSKYIKRLETNFIDAIDKNIENVYNYMDFHVADLKDHIQQRMNIIGDKLVKNAKKIQENKDLAY